MVQRCQKCGDQAKWSYRCRYHSVESLQVNKTILAVTISTLLAACGGGGTSTGTNPIPVPPVTETLETTTRISFGQIDLPTESKYTGTDNVYVNLLTTGDINGDGHDDLVLGLIRVDSNLAPSGSITPLILFFDPTTKKFKTNTQLQTIIRQSQHPRQAVLIDVDGDGHLDIFIADHGYDDSPYGAQNLLVLNKASGFVDGTYLLPQYADFSHGLIVDDFDLNGKKDLVVLNNLLTSGTKCQLVVGFTDCAGSNGQRVAESYVLFNTGTLTQGTFKLENPSDINFTLTDNLRTNRINVGASADFNRDSIPDLVIGDHGKIKILESAGVGNYKSAVLFYPNEDFKKFCGSDILPYSYISTQDLDGDSLPEIIASYSCNWTQNEFQVLKKDNGIWKDVTTSYFPDQSINRKNHDGWCYKILFEDVDADGKKDLICSTGRGFGWDTNNVFWLNKDGKFAYKDVQLADRRPSGWHTPVTLNNRRYILGLITVNRKVDILAWKLP